MNLISFAEIGLNFLICQEHVGSECKNARIRNMFESMLGS
jgi:hypothetical protein